MTEIKLTQGKIAIIDAEDFERVSQFKWLAHTKNKGKTYYVERNVRISKNKAETVSMARFILNAQKGQVVDHIDKNPLNNRKNNLRLATPQQNQFNRNYSCNNKLKTKGVFWRSSKKKFIAQIKYNGKIIYLGSFKVLGDADDAYRKAEIKYFGEFARK